jgi:hypothetical protein
MRSDPRELLAAAAALVVDEGMEYAAAKRKAARAAGHRGELPSNERLEEAVREHIAVFQADEQPAALRALRLLALAWMDRLAPFRPHLGGAAWRGTATRRSALMIDLYCDDPKSAEIALLNQRIDFDVGVRDGGGRGRGEPVDVLTLAAPCPAFQDPVTLHLLVNDLDALRGALRPDAHGRSWRGDTAALRRLLEAEAPA